MTETSRHPRSGTLQRSSMDLCAADCRSRLWQRSCSPPCSLPWSCLDFAKTITTSYLSHFACTTF